MLDDSSATRGRRSCMCATRMSSGLLPTASEAYRWHDGGLRARLCLQLRVGASDLLKSKPQSCLLRVFDQLYFAGWHLGVQYFFACASARAVSVSAFFFKPRTYTNQGQSKPTCLLGMPEGHRIRSGRREAVHHVGRWRGHVDRIPWDLHQSHRESTPGSLWLQGELL